MSRSYKKNPFVTDGYGKNRKRYKRTANHVVRRRLKQDEDMPARINHKKMTETWMICDYRWRMTREEAIQWYKEEYERHKTNGTLDRFTRYHPTLEAWLKYWDKCYRRK